MSALRRMRATDAEINFKPWIYQIARNAAIDSLPPQQPRGRGVDGRGRRPPRLRPHPARRPRRRARLRARHEGAAEPPPGRLRRALRRAHARARHARARGDVLPRDRQAARPDAAGGRERAVPRPPPARERVHRALRGAPLRGDAPDDGRGWRPASTSGAEEHRLARHARRCHDCRRRAREMGIEPLTTLGTLRQKAAALLPIPWLFRRSGDGGTITGLFSQGANAAPLAERAAALVAAAALVGAGGAALGGGALRGDRDGLGRTAPWPSTPRQGGESQRGTAGPATDGERARSAPGVRAEGRSGRGPRRRFGRPADGGARELAGARRRLGGHRLRRPGGRAAEAARGGAAAGNSGADRRPAPRSCRRSRPPAAPLPLPKVELPPVKRRRCRASTT